MDVCQFGVNCAQFGVKFGVNCVQFGVNALVKRVGADKNGTWVVCRGGEG